MELGKGAQDAANELHARHVGEHVTHAQHAEAAFRVAGQGPEPREDAGDVGVQAWNSICTEKYQLCVYRHRHAELELQRRQPESKAKLTDRFIHASLSYTVCVGDGDLALPSARSEGRLSTKTEGSGAEGSHSLPQVLALIEHLAQHLSQDGAPILLQSPSSEN